MKRRKQAFRQGSFPGIQPVAGLMEVCLRWGGSRWYPDGSRGPNAPRLNAEMMLSGLGITHRFKAVCDRRTNLRTASRNPMADLEGLWRGQRPPPNCRCVQDFPIRHSKSASAAG